MCTRSCKSAPAAMTAANPYRSIRSWVAIRVPCASPSPLKDKGYSTKTPPAKSPDIATGIGASARQLSAGLLPGIEAAVDVAGSREARLLGGLHRHRGALAEGAVEHQPLAGGFREFVEDAAATDILLQ